MTIQEQNMEQKKRVSKAQTSNGRVHEQQITVCDFDVCADDVLGDYDVTNSDVFGAFIAFGRSTVWFKPAVPNFRQMYY